MAPALVQRRATRPCVILLVEDNQDAAATMARLLECFGHAVTVAHDGVEALHVAKKTQPDVVLLDSDLP
jgi:CheY-like chemotaxis protein